MNFYVSSALCFTFLEALLKFSLKSTIIVHVKKQTLGILISLYSVNKLFVLITAGFEWIIFSKKKKKVREKKILQRPNVKVRQLFCRMQHFPMKIPLKNVLDVSLGNDGCVWNWLSLLVQNNKIFFLSPPCLRQYFTFKKETHTFWIPADTTDTTLQSYTQTHNVMHTQKDGVKGEGS